MFKSIEKIEITNFELLLIDEIGEKIFSSDLADEYGSVMLANHVMNFLNLLDCSKKMSFIEFDDVKLMVYFIDEFRVFFIYRNNLTLEDKSTMKRIIAELKNILEV